MQIAVGQLMPFRRFLVIVSFRIQILSILCLLLGSKERRK
jgi:hypothetical protein